MSSKSNAMTLSSKLSKSLAERRKELGMSQKKLGEIIGVSRQTIIDWENDAAAMTVCRIEPLAAALGWPVSKMLGIEEVPGHSIAECARRIYSHFQAKNGMRDASL